jgi:hypothetical protein
VVKANKRAEMVQILRQSVAHKKVQGEQTGSAEWTANVMEQAPVTVFIFNPTGMQPWLAHSIELNFMDVVDIQSVGAAIQNMLLAA